MRIEYRRASEKGYYILVVSLSRLDGGPQVWGNDLVEAGDTGSGRSHLRQNKREKS